MLFAMVVLVEAPGPETARMDVRDGMEFEFVGEAWEVDPMTDGYDTGSLLEMRDLPEPEPDEDRDPNWMCP